MNVGLKVDTNDDKFESVAIDNFIKRELEMEIKLRSDEACLESVESKRNDKPSKQEKHPEKS